MPVTLKIVVDNTNGTGNDHNNSDISIADAKLKELQY